MAGGADDDRAVVDEEDFSVRRSIRVDAPVERVWEVVTDPAYVSRWLGRTTVDGRRPGAEGTVTFDGEAPVPIRVEAVDAPRSVSYRWRNELADAGSEPLDERGSTVFTFTLEPVGDGTRLTVVETGFGDLADPLGELESHRAGWDSELEELVELLAG